MTHVGVTFVSYALPHQEFAIRSTQSRGYLRACRKASVTVNQVLTSAGQVRAQVCLSAGCCQSAGLNPACALKV